VVASQIWCNISEVVGSSCGSDFVSIDQFIASLAHNWKILCPEGKLPELELMIEKLKHLAKQLGRLAVQPAMCKKSW